MDPRTRITYPIIAPIHKQALPMNLKTRLVIEISNLPPANPTIASKAPNLRPPLTHPIPPTLVSNCPRRCCTRIQMSRKNARLKTVAWYAVSMASVSAVKNSQIHSPCLFVKSNEGIFPVISNAKRDCISLRRAGIHDRDLLIVIFEVDATSFVINIRGNARNMDNFAALMTYFGRFARSFLRVKR